MGHRARFGCALAFAAVLVAGTAYDQTIAPTSAVPNPYRSVEGWAQMPQGRIWGAVSAVDVDLDGKSIWVLERCGAQGFVPPTQMRPDQVFNCDGSDLAPILKFDADGKLVKSFGAGLIVFPHGMHVDRDGNIWVTDGAARNGKGQQVLKFAPDGRLLMRIGKQGVGGPGNDEFNAPSAVTTAPNGDVFVADGHGRDTNARIVKFDKHGKFIKTWGKKGSAAGDVDIPHTIAMDSRGRLFVGDRNNNRIQIFDQDGKSLDMWSQFSRPSSIFIDKNDIITVADSESGGVAKDREHGYRGIRVGRIADGVVTAFIPDPAATATTTSAAEGVAVDAAGNIYGAEVGPKRLMRYVKR